MNGSRPARVDALSGLRFAAALAILGFHVGAPLLAGAPAWAERIRAGGYVWVGLFYVLSGFVLAYAHASPDHFASPGARRAFLAARLARLYPAYLLAFVLYAPFALERWWGGGPGAVARGAVVALACLLLVQAWLPPLARIWNPPGWSTSVVASFYVAFPWLHRRLAPRSRAALWRVALAAWLASLALPLAYLALAPDGPGAVLLAREPRWLEALKFHPVARAGEFAAGVALGLLVRTRGVTLGRAGGPLALAALAAAAAVLAWGRVPYVLLHDGALVPLFAVAVLGLASDATSPPARALASRAGRALGDAAFALYALQDPLWRWARALAGEATPPTPAFAAAFCAVATAIAVAVSRGMERPARRWLRRWLALPPPSPRAERAQGPAPDAIRSGSRA
jgi:peptidoglycan/LPS O-acetylase OafA/YrhL